MVTKLVLFRHGYYDKDGLTNSGRVWMQPAVEMLAKELSGFKVEDIKLISSPAVRALQTAEVIADRLSIPHSDITQHDCLFDAGNSLKKSDEEEFMSLLENEYSSFPVLLAATHFPMTSHFMHAYSMAKNMGGWRTLDLDKGQGVLFDMSEDPTKNYIFLR